MPDEIIEPVDPVIVPVDPVDPVVPFEPVEPVAPAAADPAIPASNPTVIPPTPGRELDQWLVSSLLFSGDGVRTPMMGEAWFVKAKNTDGVWDVDDSIKVNLHIPDVWAKAATDPEVAQAIGALILVLNKLGNEAGIL